MRCQCKNITNNLICKNKMKNLNYFIEKKICNFHYNYYRNKYANIIQKFYKSYKCRRYINNIYIKLPLDIQNVINYKIREQHYINRYHNVIKNIIITKIIKFIDYMDNNINLYNYNINNEYMNFIMFIFNNYKYIEKNYYLYSKYKIILIHKSLNDYNIFKTSLNIYNRKILTALKYYEQNIFNAYSSHVFDIVSALSYRLNNYIKSYS